MKVTADDVYSKTVYNTKKRIYKQVHTHLLTFITQQALDSVESSLF